MVGVAPPVIAAQPEPQTVTGGASVTFSVSAVGTLPLSYQWQYNGADLFAATNAILVISNAQAANSGSYRVWVANAAGSMCSQPVTLSVFNPPVITIQPLSTSVAVGASATLQVAAGGTQPLTYQWYFNDSLLTTANGTSLLLTGVGSANAGTYRVVVTNTVGTAISYPAILKVTGIDSDGDGIPDSWMIQNFGHPIGLAGDHSRAQDDADGDGLSNQQEYLAGTIPLDSQSCLKLHVVGVNPGKGQPQFSFTAVAGFDYTLEYCENLGSGLWHKLNDVPADPTTRIVQVNDPGSASPTRFYRVVTPIQPYLDYDSDGDGIPDYWMMQQFGHATGLASDRSRAQDDADGEGMSNLQEYLAGTIPLNPQSCLKLHLLGVTPGTAWPQLSFTAVAGIGYTVEYSGNPGAGLWHKLTDVAADPTSRIVTVIDPGAASAPRRFYRVVTPIQPYLDQDSDGDGIPDHWMMQQFGHPTGLAGDRSRAQDDADLDGMSNLQEYLTGTNPLDAQSCLKLQTRGVDTATGRAQISFTAMPGISYTLQYADNVTAGRWHKLNDVPAGSATRIIMLNDPGAAAMPIRFYRVVTPIQP